MRILYLSTKYPLPTNSGTKMRLWSILSALAHAGHDVTLAALVNQSEAPQSTTELYTVCRDALIVFKKIGNFASSSNYLDRLLSIFSSEPYTTYRFHSRELRDALESKLSQCDFDAVICDEIFSAINLPKCNLPLAMNSHNVESLILQRYADLEKNLFKALYVRWEAHRLRRFETSMFSRANIGMVCSEADRQRISRFCPHPMFVVPNVIDVGEYKEIDGDQDPSTILYLGDMKWFPNYDALDHFVHRILPYVQREVPDVRMIAVGRDPSPSVRARFSDVKALEFTGMVQDVRPFIRRATVSVIPLRIGSGTRWKILECAAMGKAMISTTIGAEGLAFQTGKEILIADDSRHFAQQLVELLHDPQYRFQLGAAARDRVASDYSLPVLKRSLMEALDCLH
jgi:glycosyltransferase involved in cell wall biosynthesis